MDHHTFHKPQFTNILVTFISTSNTHFQTVIHICTALLFPLYWKRREGGRKEGREGGREGGRKEGRKEGREGGREEGREGGRERDNLNHPLPNIQ